MDSLSDVFIKSKQIADYEQKENRQSLSKFYISERITLEKVLPHVKTVTDIGCLNGDAYKAISEKYDVSYLGIDVDKDAIQLAQQRYPNARFAVGDFMDESFTQEKSDLVFALNLFDHFEDWKKALRNLRRFSSRFINFSTLMRYSGNTVVDRDISYIYYSNAQRRLLWAIHNIFELTSYCATEDIKATNIFVYCYHKYNQIAFNNLERAAIVSYPLPLDELLVGNVLIEFDEENYMAKSRMRPDLKIVIDGKVAFDSPWKKQVF